MNAVASRLLGRLGIDPAVLSLLLRLQIRRDFEGATARAASTGEGLDDSPLIVNVAYNLSLSLLVAYFAFVNFEPFGFAFLQMLVLMVAVAMTMVSEFGVALIDPDDHAMLAPLPIAPRTYFAARAVNALFYVAVIASSWSVPGAILAVFVHGGSIAAGVLHLVASFAAALLGTALVIFGYGVLARLAPPRRLHDLTLYGQVLFSLALFLGFLYGPALLPDSEGFLRFSRTGAAFLCPPAWFAALAAWEPSALTLLGAASPLLALAALARLSMRYASHLRSHASTRRPSERETRRMSPIARLFRRVFVRDDEQAAFEFSWLLMARERPFRLRTYPLIGFPLALLVLALASGSSHDRLLWLFLLMYAPILYFPAIVSLLPYTSNPDAAWIIRSAPIPGRHAVVLGAEKAFLLRFVAPLYAVVAAFAAWAWNPVEGIGNSAAAFLVACLFTAFDFTRLEDLPFTRPASRTFSKIDTSHFMGRVILLAILSSAQFLLIGRSPFALAVLLPSLGAVLVALLGWQRRPASA